MIAAPLLYIELHNLCHYSFGPLPKSSNPARVVTNVEVYDFEISEEDMKLLNALDRGKEGTITWNPVDVE